MTIDLEPNKYDSINQHNRHDIKTEKDKQLQDCRIEIERLNKIITERNQEIQIFIDTRKILTTQLESYQVGIKALKEYLIFNPSLVLELIIKTFDHVEK